MVLAQGSFLPLLIGWIPHLLFVSAFRLALAGQLEMEEIDSTYPFAREFSKLGRPLLCGVLAT